MGLIQACNVGDLERIGNHAGSNTDSVGTQRDAFTDLLGITVDPTSVVLAVERPDGTRLAYGWPSPGADGLLTKESVGRFYIDLIITQSGKWWWSLTGAGTVVATTGDSEFWARATRL